MKKLLCAVLVIAMAFAMVLSACGKDEATNTTAATEATEATEATTAAAAEVTTIKDGVLTMATNAAFPPYEYYDGDKIVGIDAEIAQAIADKLGLTLEIEDMKFDSLITSVTSGGCDVVLAGMTITEDRLKSVNFSDSYATGIQVIIVKEGSSIKTKDDIMNSDCKVGVQLSTTGDIYATGDYGSDRVVEYQFGADAVLALTKGEVECVIIDNEPAKAFVEKYDGLVILEAEYITEEYAIAIDKGNTELLTAVNNALAELTADGTLDTIVAKYISAN